MEYQIDQDEDRQKSSAKTRRGLLTINRSLFFAALELIQALNRVINLWSCRFKGPLRHVPSYCHGFTRSTRFSGVLNALDSALPTYSRR